MSVKNVNIYPTDNPKQLAQNVQAELNAVIAQVNQNTGTLATHLDANQNQLKNVGNPSVPGDAVNLQTMQNAISTMSTNMFKILNRRTPDPYLNAPSGTGTGGSGAYTIIFKAAEAQGGTPILGMTYLSTAAPSGTVISGAHITYAAEVFTGGVYVQDRFPLPANFTALSSLVIYWMAPTGTPNPTWELDLVDVTSGSAIDVAYSTAGTVTSTATNSLILVTATIVNTYGGLVGGDMCFFKFSRTDGGADFAGLLELQFNVSHS